MNYDLKFIIGEMYSGMPILKAVAKSDKGVALPGAKAGYGINEVEAAQDFIRRNASAVLDKIFDSK